MWTYILVNGNDYGIPLGYFRRHCKVILKRQNVVFKTDPNILNGIYNFEEIENLKIIVSSV